MGRPARSVAIPWFVSHPALRTPSAEQQAKRLAQRLDDYPSNETASKLLHVAAYRVSRHAQFGRVKACWYRRWLSIRSQMAERNIGLVYLFKRKFSGLELDDLVSEGQQGLLHAIDRFNPFLGYKFTTYATQAIWQGLARQCKRAARQRDRAPFSYDESAYKYPQEYVVPDDAPIEEIQGILKYNTANLTDMERFVIEQRFMQPTRLTLEQVGAMVELTKERIWQLQCSALAKLRAKMELALA